MAESMASIAGSRSGGMPPGITVGRWNSPLGAAFSALATAWSEIFMPGSLRTGSAAGAASGFPRRIQSNNFMRASWHRG
ncbi:hypothetical protein G6F50_018246 [Rhizopus delemar]|uniref:Uncharacterized protein n=1 Tax=Rhizopus delemar TaxID=936053 RepID=A0A9P7BZH1_9FUNG|nr:hypothetical protein G6F50_018246 [Rhizopus delemar]